MPDKKYTARLKLTRREQEIVGGFAENFLAWDELNENDAREKIYEEIVKHKFGGYDTRGERLTREPMWNLVFPKNLCPECNTDHEILKGTAIHLLYEDGENCLCRNCGFTVKKSLWDEGKKSNEKEKEIKQKDREFAEKIKRYNYPKEQLDELAKKGVMEAQRASRMKTQDEEGK